MIGNYLTVGRIDGREGLAGLRLQPLVVDEDTGVLHVRLSHRLRQAGHTPVLEGAFRSAF